MPHAFRYPTSAKKVNAFFFSQCNSHRTQQQAPYLSTHQILQRTCLPPAHHSSKREASSTSHVSQWQNRHRCDNRMDSTQYILSGISTPSTLPGGGLGFLRVTVKFSAVSFQYQKVYRRQTLIPARIRSTTSAKQNSQIECFFNFFAHI